MIFTENPFDGILPSQNPSQPAQRSLLRFMDMQKECYVVISSEISGALQKNNLLS